MKSKGRSDSGAIAAPSSKFTFYTAITRVAVAQICRTVGYRGAQRPAIDALTDIAATYLRWVASYAAASTASTGRTQPNLLDLLRSFEDLHSAIGFSGASDITRRCCAPSPLVLDMIKFVKSNPEIPFPKPIPRRQHPTESIYECRNGDRCDRNRNHIPKWLPPIRVPTAIPNRKDDCGENAAGLTEGKVDDGDKRRENSNRSIMLELPKKRKRVSFKIGTPKNETPSNNLSHFDTYLNH